MSMEVASPLLLPPPVVNGHWRTFAETAGLLTLRITCPAVASRPPELWVGSISQPCVTCCTVSAKPNSC